MTLTLPREWTDWLPHSDSGPAEPTGIANISGGPSLLSPLAVGDIMTSGLSIGVESREVDSSHRVTRTGESSKEISYLTDPVARTRTDAGELQLGQAVAAAVRRQVRRIRRLTGRHAKRIGPDRLHEVRIALRRLDAALTLGHDAAQLPPDALWDPLRRWSHDLSRLRDVDVARERLGQIGRELLPAERVPLERLSRRLAGRRPSLESRVRSSFRGKRARRSLDALGQWADKPIFFPIGHRALAAVASALVAHDIRRALGRRIWSIELAESAEPTEPNMEALHELRKDVRGVRYALETFHRAGLPLNRPVATFARAAQDCLGEIHDHAELVERLPRAVSPAVRTALDRRWSALCHRWVRLQGLHRAMIRQINPKSLRIPPTAWRRSDRASPRPA